MFQPSALFLQNTLALASLPVYLASRPALRWRGLLHAKPDGPWVFGGHSGRLYADNAAAVHGRASELGRDVRFVVSDEALEQTLAARGFRTLRRNSFAARLAIENAELLVYSHGLSDLDHALARAVTLRGLKVHLFHSLTFLKADQLAKSALAVRDPGFDYLLAVTERERSNMLRSFPGQEARIVFGGGAHLDTFMRARGQAPARSIVYFPTHRDGAASRARLERQVAELVAHPRMLAFLEREDLHLDVVAHINRAAYVKGAAAPTHPRVRWLAPTELVESVLQAGVFISDYSGLLFDQLALGRPAIFFPFDREDYLRERALHVDYATLAWGPHVTSVEALIDVLDSGRYRADPVFDAARAYWERECFPRLTPDYTDDTLRTLDALLARRAAPSAHAEAAR